MLTFDDATVQGALDVSDWFKIGYQEQRKFTCVVPCHWALTAYLERESRLILDVDS